MKWITKSLDCSGWPRFKNFHHLTYFRGLKTAVEIKCRLVLASSGKWCKFCTCERLNVLKRGTVDLIPIEACESGRFLLNILKSLIELFSLVGIWSWINTIQRRGEIPSRWVCSYLISWIFKKNFFVDSWRLPLNCVFWKRKMQKL